MLRRCAGRAHARSRSRRLGRPSRTSLSRECQRANHAFRLVGLEGGHGHAGGACALRGSTPVVEAIQLCEERSRPTPNACASMRISVADSPSFARLLGDIDGARAASEVARAQSADLGDEAGLMTSAAAFLGSVEALAEDWERAEKIFRPALAYARDQPIAAHVAGVLPGATRRGRARRVGDPDAAVVSPRRRAAYASPVISRPRFWWRRVAVAPWRRRSGSSRGLDDWSREAVGHADDVGRPRSEGRGEARPGRSVRARGSPQARLPRSSA